MTMKNEKEKNATPKTPVIDKKENTALSKEELEQISGGGQNRKFPSTIGTMR